MELEKTMAEQLQKLVDGGKVEEIIEKQLTATVTSIFNDVLRDYSDFGKALKDKIKACIVLPLDKVSMPSYAVMMEKSIMEVLDGTIMQDSIGPVKQTIRKYLTALEKTEWKLSEIVNAIGIDAVGDYDGEEKSCEIELKVDERGHGSIWIYIATDDHKYNFAINDSTSSSKEIGELWHFSIDDKKLDPRKEVIYNHNIDSFIFNLYACRAKITIDEDHCELYYTNCPD